MHEVGKYGTKQTLKSQIMQCYIKTLLIVILFVQSDASSAGFELLILFLPNADITILSVDSLYNSMCMGGLHAEPMKAKRGH